MAYAGELAAAPPCAAASLFRSSRSCAEPLDGFALTRASFQSQTRAKCVLESRLRDTPVTRRRAPHRRRPCVATGSTQRRAEPPIRSMSHISVCSRAIPPAEPRADARAAPTYFAPSDQDPMGEIRSKPESTACIPVNPIQFCKRAPHFSRNQAAVHASSKVFLNQSCFFCFNSCASTKLNLPSRSCSFTD